MGQVEVEVEG
jgi:hypothetical protein